MFIYSFKLSKKRIGIFAGVIVAAVLVTVGAIAIKSSPAAAYASGVRAELTGSSNEQRVDFVQSFGHLIEAEPANVIEMVIPKEFNEDYKGYNALQQEVGFNLEKYAGKRVKRYSYKITNYNTGISENLFARVIVFDDKIIGGDVCLDTDEGFTHNLSDRGELQQESEQTGAVPTMAVAENAYPTD